MLKKLFLINLLFLSFCFSHQKESAKLNISSIDEKRIKIEVLDSRTNKEIFLSQIKIIASKNGEILNEFLLSKENQIINIPEEDYYILAKIGDNLIYKKSSLYEILFLFFCSIIFLISLVIYLLRIKKYIKFNNN